MSLMPDKTGVSDTYPNPDNATANAAFGALWEAMYEALEKPELDLASAATVDLGGQLSTKLRITGTTGISSFGTTYRGPILIRFAGIVTLTHHATTLILPGAANLTTSAGGVMIAYPKATVSGTHDGWIVVFASDYFAKAGADSSITSLNGLTDLPSFSAKNISSLSSSGSNQTILNGSEDFDTHGCYNPATGTFIADRAGKYVFNAAAGIESVTTAGMAGIEFTKNGVNGQRRAQKIVQIGEFDNLTLSGIFDLAAGDTVNVQLNATSAVFAIANTNFQTYFNGYRIR